MAAVAELGVAVEVGAKSGNGTYGSIEMGNNLTILKLFTPTVAKRRIHAANSSVLITGASSGIGRGLTLAYARRNCEL